MLLFWLVACRRWLRATIREGEMEGALGYVNWLMLCVGTGQARRLRWSKSVGDPGMGKCRVVSCRAFLYVSDGRFPIRSNSFYLLA